MTRVTGLCTSLLTLLTLTLAGPPPAAAAEPIRIGFMAPLTGIFAQSGKDMLDGLKLSLEQLGSQAAGRKIELIEEDDEGNPARALAKFRKMATQDRIHVLNGVLLSNIGYSLVAPIETEKLPALYLTTPDDLTKRKPPKYIMRSNFAGSQNMHPLGDYAAKVLKYKRVATIAMDNPFGHEQIGGFHRVFEDNGGAVVQKTWVPLNAMDFAPYLAQLRRDVDAVVSVFVAAQSIRFMKQYADAGLQARLPVLASGVQMDEHALRAMGDEALGAVSALHWSPMLDNPANKKFLQLAEASFGKRPSYFSAVMYSTGLWIAKAAELVGGRVEDRDKFIAALRRAMETVEDPRGPIKLDDFNNPTENIYILKVERVGGKLVNVPIHTYPMVSQFWTYKAEDFLKQPVYSRDYPPAKP